MGFSPELLKQLVATFQAELEEGAMTLTNGLVELEKPSLDQARRTELIATVFRAAHNLKGASRGLGINTVGDITHHIESIFSTFKSKNDVIPKSVIDICLEAVDKMQIALQAYISESELSFDINDLLARMEASTAGDIVPTTASVKKPQADAHSRRKADNKVKKNTPIDNNESLQTNDTMRVPLSIIDRLSELSEEIQVSKIMMDDHSYAAQKVAYLVENFANIWRDMNIILSDLHGKSGGLSLQKALNNANDEIMQIQASINKFSSDMKSHAIDYARLSKSVHDDVALLRLVPANNFLGMLPRSVREIANSLGKEIDFTVTGGDTYIDKYVLQGLKDPINHILRNAVDHGIETVNARLASGKPRAGSIKISVRDAGGKLCFDISDDGAGIDHDKIKQKVLNMDPEKADKLNELSADEIQQYIFQPGFSTKNEVTSISGRGVGMDVVKKNIQSLKGSVSIKSEHGKGTTITICVPLSLSSERGLIVRSNEQIFVIPTSSIERVTSISKNDIRSIEGRHVILNEDSPVLLKPLSGVLGFGNENNSNDNVAAIILEVGDDKIALAVDEIVGEREIVIKPIQDPLAELPCVSGATLLDRNKIAIVLNPGDLIRYSLNSNVQYFTEKALDDSTADRGEEPLRVLVVDDSITTRTLEKNILESKKYHVTTAVNGQEAWEILQKQPFSIMITDINMPIMDGFELTERVKKSEKLAAMPVIIITSLGSDAEKARGIEVGADAYIVKNEFESGALLQMIERLV